MPRATVTRLPVSPGPSQHLDSAWQKINQARALSALIGIAADVCGDTHRDEIRLAAEMSEELLSAAHEELEASREAKP